MIVVVSETERFPDYSLQPSQGEPGHLREVAGDGWILRTRIQLSDDEYRDWLRVEKEYEQWLNRIGEKIRELPRIPPQ